jgi:hypothetical protein
MTHISGFERSQLLLSPEAIDDYVVADNPVRFIAAPDREDETLFPLGNAAGETLDDLAETHCASDAEFVENLRYLFAEEVRLEFAVDSVHVAVATYLGEIEMRDSTWPRIIRERLERMTTWTRLRWRYKLAKIHALVRLAIRLRGKPLVRGLTTGKADVRAAFAYWPNLGHAENLIH